MKTQTSTPTLSSGRARAERCKELEEEKDETQPNTEREIPRKWRPNPKNQPSNRPKGRRRTEGDRRGSLAQGPGTKTEAGNRPGRAGPGKPRPAPPPQPGRRKRGPKEPQSRSRSHARASASATPLLNTRMTASTSQRRHGATARVRPTHGTRHRREREPGTAPSCPGIRSQKENEDRRPHNVRTWDKQERHAPTNDAAPQAGQEY